MALTPSQRIAKSVGRLHVTVFSHFVATRFIAGLAGMRSSRNRGDVSCAQCQLRGLHHQSIAHTTMSKLAGYASQNGWMLLLCRADT
jgi:hypothetical protein